ncbi:hypothetical protein DFH08DRAFT_1027116, partial [Mycena albidolilacea]
MSTTTQILFNSPALHSLKRDQLVKLCKIHSIKANGKNVELVERLKSHAKSLPRDNPLSVAMRSEQEGAPEAPQNGEEEEGGVAQAFNPRPSSQWEVVMDSITEEQEDSSSSQGSATISSLKSNKSGNTTTTVPGEFGSTSSKSTSTVTSSIRALASSLGLKRHATNASTSSKLLASFPLPPLPRSTDAATDELLKHSTPYDALPPPSPSNPLQTDHFTFDPTDPAALAAAGLALASNPANPTLNPTLGTAPLPGHSLRPGVPAPANARLSLGLAPRTPSKRGPTTTIRLVSSSALNADTTANTTAAPARTLPPPGGTPNLKPFKTTFDLDMDIGSPTTAFPASSGSGSLYPALPAAFPAPSGALYPSLPASPPMDDAERRMSLEASTSMHAEDNNAQQDEDDDEPMPGAFTFAPTSTPSRIPAPAFVFGSPSPPAGGAPRFSFAMPASPGVMEEMNRRVFGFGAPGTPTSPRVVRPLPGSARRERESLGGATPARNGGKKEGRFDKAHAEVFGRMESIADVAARKEGLLKRKASTSSIAGGGSGVGGQQGKRVRVEEGGAGPATTNAGNTETEAEAKQKEREKEAIRRKLEISRARRRSSAAAGGGARRVSGRVSGAGVLVKPKPAASRGRFGFFAGAAKLVQGVWGGGK